MARKHVARDALIVTHWNAQKTFKQIGLILRISVNSISSAIRQARKRGEEVRTSQPRGNGRRQSPAQKSQQQQACVERAKNEPRSFDKAHSFSEWNQKLRKARKGWSSRTLDDQLPEHSKQCRWLHGDLLDGGVQCCTHTRECTDLALLDDQFPYCETHRKAAIYRPERTAPATAHQRIVRSKYGYSYATTAS